MDLEDESNYELVALGDQPVKAIRLKRALTSGSGSGSGKDNIRLNVCMYLISGDA